MIVSRQLKCPNSKTLYDPSIADPARSEYAPAGLTQSHQLLRVKGSTLNPSAHAMPGLLRESFDVMTHVQQLSTNLQAGEFLLCILVHLPEHECQPRDTRSYTIRVY
jgi:hypothetical protein